MYNVTSTTTTCAVIQSRSTSTATQMYAVEEQPRVTHTIVQQTESAGSGGILCLVLTQWSWSAGDTFPMNDNTVGEKKMRDPNVR